MEKMEILSISIILFYNYFISRGRVVVARQAHNLEIVGSNPSPASINFSYQYNFLSFESFFEYIFVIVKIFILALMNFNIFIVALLMEKYRLKWNNLILYYCLFLGIVLLIFLDYSIKFLIHLHSFLKEFVKMDNIFLNVYQIHQ